MNSGVLIIGFSVTFLATTSAHAQVIEAMQFELVWDQNVMTPGSGINHGTIYAKLSPEIGSMGAWNTPPGTGQVGPIEAYASSKVNLLNLENGLSGDLWWWSPSWGTLVNLPGTPDGQGGIFESHYGQAGKTVNPNPLTENTVPILYLSWDAQGDYTPRTVTYETVGTSAKVYLSITLPNGQTAWAAEKAEFSGMKTSFQVIPAPAAALVIGGCGLISQRRRRS